MFLLEYPIKVLQLAKNSYISYKYCLSDKKIKQESPTVQTGDFCIYQLVFWHMNCYFLFLYGVAPLNETL